MALRQKRIIFVICPEPTDHSAGRSDARVGFCTAFYFLNVFLVFFSTFFSRLLIEPLRSLRFRVITLDCELYSTLDEFYKSKLIN